MASGLPVAAPEELSTDPTVPVTIATVTESIANVSLQT